MTDIPEQWLAELNQSLDDVLDIDAGLRDAQLPGQRTKLDHVLDDVLDVEAGLNAILPPSRTPQPSPGSDEQAAARRDDSTPALALAAYARRLMTSAVHVRLTTRAQLPHRELAKANSAALSRLLAEPHNHAVAVAIDTAHDLAHSLVNRLAHIRTYSSRYRLRHHLAVCRVSVQELIRTLAVAHHALDGDPLLARALADAKDVVTAIHRDLLRHDGNLELAVELVHDLALTFERTYTPNLEAALIRVYAKLPPTHDLAKALDQDLTYGRARDFDETFATALMEALAWLTEATTDFTESDLTAVDLEGIPLQGLRWSSTTQWPPGWEEPIRQASIQLETDLYEIRDDPRIRSHLTR